MFSLVDVILILIVGAFVFFGLFFGLIHTLGSLVGTLLGIIISSRLVEPMTDTFGGFFGGGGAAKVIIFIIIFLLVSRVIGLLFWAVEKVLGVLAWIPFAGMVNRLLGGIFGLIEGIIVVGVILFFALQYLDNSFLKAALETSVVAKYLLAAVAALQVLYPDAVRTVQEQAAQQQAPVTNP